MSEDGDEKTTAAEKPKHAGDVHLSLLDRFVMPVVIAFVAFAASFAAATIANDGAARNQEAQFREERANDARERRSAIYTAYLDAVGEFAPMFHRSTDCYLQKASQDTLNSFPDECRDAFPAEYRTTVDRLTLAVGKIRVHGTRNVYSAAGELHRVLLAMENSNIVYVVRSKDGTPDVPAPNSRDQRDTSGEKPGLSVHGIATALERTYESAYEAYIVAMCDELSTDPANC